MQTQSFLLDNEIPDIPSTEGIKYTGSKRKLLPYILALSKKTGAQSVFAGSTRVSQAFAWLGYRVVSNDLAECSRVLGTCYLKNKKHPKEYRPLIDHLNSMPPEDGWFTKHYGVDVNSGQRGNAIQIDGTKKPWQKKNTRKLDAIRREIDALKLDKIAKSVALTSLILALDQVDSALGHFASYLKDWSPRSYKDLKLQVPRLWKNQTANTVLCGDVFQALSNIKAELAYYDPPYGSNNDKMPSSRIRYASYYHLWTTVCKNDHPSLFGKPFHRKDSSDEVAASIFEEFRRNNFGRFITAEAIERLLKETPCPWILLSYSSEGRAAAEELNEAIEKYGKLVEIVEVDYKKNVISSIK